MGAGISGSQPGSRDDADDTWTDVRDVLGDMLTHWELPDSAWANVETLVRSIRVALISGERRDLANHTRALFSVDEKRNLIGARHVVPAPPRVRELATPILEVLRLADAAGSEPAVTTLSVKPPASDWGRRVQVHAIELDKEHDRPIVILKEVDGARRYLPIWTEKAVATAITYAKQGVTPLYGETHDLLCDILQFLNASIERARILALVDNVFRASISIGGGEVPARAADAIILSLKTGAPLFVNEDVMAEGGMDIPRLNAKPT